MNKIKMKNNKTISFMKDSQGFKCKAHQNNRSLYNIIGRINVKKVKNTIISNRLPIVNLDLYPISNITPRTTSTMTKKNKA
jgi:hypothetical protein